MFDEDRDQFVDTADFGVYVLWGTKSFNALFDNESYQVQGENNVEVDEQEPMLKATDESILGLKYGDVLEPVDDNLFAHGWKYSVKSLRPDGTGFTEIGLMLIEDIPEEALMQQSWNQHRNRNRGG